MTMADLLFPSTARATMSSLFVCRVSGLPYDSLMTPESGPLTHAVDRIAEIESILQQSRDYLSAQLHEQIGLIGDPKVRRTAIDLRRALFNMRTVPAAALEVIERAVPGAVAAATKEAAQLVDERLVLIARCSVVHEHVLSCARDGFRNAVCDEDFQKGLVLSSESLFQNLPKYRERKSSGSRLDQIERGLLRYFTRMSAKATPFGRFCAVIGGEMVDTDGPAPLLEFVGDPRPKRSVVRLNKRIYARLWSRLITSPAVRRTLRVELNPTLRVAANSLTFMTSKGPQEIFQHLQTSEVLDVVIEVVRDALETTLAQVVSRLTTDPRVEATEDEATAFCEKLIEVGFLRLLAIVPEQEANWLPPVSDFLRRIDDEIVREVLPVLDELRELAAGYENGTAGSRAALLNRMRAAVNELVTVAGAPGPKESPIFEDTTADSTLRMSVTPELAGVNEALADFVRLTMPLAGSAREMATMRHFVDTHYGDRSLEGIPLLEFYEAFYREHFKGHMERIQTPVSQQRSPGERYDAQNPFGLERIKVINRASRQISDYVRRVWVANPSAEEIDLTAEGLAECVSDVGASVDLGRRSVGMFLQLISAEKGPRFVLQNGRYFAGYGKYFSRFLYLLPDLWLETVQSENQNDGEVILAEISSDAAFNANLHPPLVEREIAYPTGQHAPSARVLKSADLVVFPDPDDPHALVLREGARGAKVWPLDLGFLNPMMRPPLFQLLARFSPVGFFGLALPTRMEPDRRPDDGSQQVVCRPRIVFAGRVVLARRCWTIPQSLFPAATPGETEAAQYLRVQSWRRTYGVPSVAYVRINVSPSGLAGTVKPNEEPPAPAEDVADEAAGEGADEAGTHASGDIDAMETVAKPEGKEGDGQANGGNQKERPRFSRDYGKPQFIDFSNPLLVRLFARITSGLKQFTVVIEECLPEAAQLPRHDGKPYATELIMQVRFNAETSA